MTKNKVVVLGGSGIQDSPAFEGLEWKLMDTEFSNGVGNGKVYYQERKDGVIFIPRHGYGEMRYGPSVTQYAANLIAAKMLGATVVIATSAVGSLQPEKIGVGSLVIPDDYIDESLRNDNLFGEGIIIHGNPRPAFSEKLRQILYNYAFVDLNCFSSVHESGTYVCIPGDRFGTTAEGKKRARYADIVGMTLCPEASMAMQLGLHYAVAAFPVDSDTDANHEKGTLAVMKRLSASDKVPAYIARVIEKAKTFAAEAGPLEQLKGNIICIDIFQIENNHLRNIAKELIQTYCK